MKRNKVMNPRLVDEICSVGKLECYRRTIHQILTAIHNNGCNVSTRYDVGYSNFQISKERGAHIGVSLINVSNPLDIIWKLLHEYGHYLSEPEKYGDQLMQREEKAWEFADKLVLKYSDLSLKIADYDNCKMACLASYRKMLNKLP